MEELTNPYSTGAGDDPALAPFAGRQAAFTRLHQHLKAPESSGALTFIAHARYGKTAFLRRFSWNADETLVAVFIPLEQMRLSSEDELIHAIVRYTFSLLARWDITLSHLPPLPEQTTGLRDWLADDWLPELWRVIRPHRQLVLLLDDAQSLIDAIRDGQLPADSPAYLQALLTRHPQLRMVMTLAAERETELGTLAPLVTPAHTLRFYRLSADESAWLLREPVKRCYSLPGPGTDEIYRAAGGQPRLMQRFGRSLFDLWARDPSHTSLTPEDVKAVLPQVYAESESELAALWEQSTPHEQLILTAMSRLFYNDPLTSIDREAITNWLIETEYPLDSTAVNAALRRLEYREVIAVQPQGHITFTIGLLHRWLMEHARLHMRKAEAGSAASLAFSQRTLIITAAVVIVLALLLAAVLSSSPAPRGDLPLPTATLVNSP